MTDWRWKIFIKNKCWILAWLICATGLGAEVRLDNLDLKNAKQGWGAPSAGKSVDGHALSIGGKKFAAGIGTHAAGGMLIDTGGKAQSFSAWLTVTCTTFPVTTVRLKLPNSFKAALFPAES
jgi:hypothetical protein